MFTLFFMSICVELCVHIEWPDIRVVRIYLNPLFFLEIWFILSYFHGSDLNPILCLICAKINFFN